MRVHIPTPDELWQQRDVPLRRIATAAGCSTHTAWNASRRAGFRRDHTGRVTHAPCAGCGGDARPRDQLNDARLCSECSGGEQELTPVQREFRMYVERMARRGVNVERLAWR